MMAEIDELARAERLAYHKSWRAANRDKVRRQNEKYWIKMAERKLLEKQAVNDDVTKNADDIIE